MSSTPRRLLLASPFLLSTYYCFTHLLTIPLIPAMHAISDTRNIQTASGPFTLPVSPYLPTAIDDLLRLLTTGFAPVLYDLDPLSAVQVRSFILDAGLVYALLLLESSRACNRFSPAAVPALLGLAAQLRGFGAVCAPFFALYWVFAPVGKLAGPEGQVGRRYGGTLLVGMVVAFHAPLMVGLLAGTWEGRFWGNYVWQPFPITIAVVQWVLGQVIGLVGGGEGKGRKGESSGIVVVTIVTLVLTSAMTWVQAVLMGEYTLGELFVPEVRPEEGKDLVEMLRSFLQLDELFGFGNVYLWMFYSFYDLKAAKVVQYDGLILAVIATLSTIAIGPGATIGIAWLWRESCLQALRGGEMKNE